MELREGGFDTIGEQLDSGVLDAALTYDLGLSAQLERRTLLTLKPYAMLAASHPLAKHKSIKLKQLTRCPLILTEQALSWQHILELFSHARVEVTVAMRASSFELQRSMVASGFGVAIAYTRPKRDQSYPRFGPRSKRAGAHFHLRRLCTRRVEVPYGHILPGPQRRNRRQLGLWDEFFPTRLCRRDA